MERQCYLWDAAVIIRYSIVHVRWPNVGVMTLVVLVKDLIDCLVFAVSILRAIDSERWTYRY